MHACNACRDVFNEKPTLEEVGAAALEGGEGDNDAEALPRGAVIHTSKGDIALKMFPEECPKTVENFATHARNGYYDGARRIRVCKHMHTCWHYFLCTARAPRVDLHLGSIVFSAACAHACPVG